MKLDIKTSGGGPTGGENAGEAGTGSSNTDSPTEVKTAISVNQNLKTALSRAFLAVGMPVTFKVGGAVILS